MIRTFTKRTLALVLTVVMLVSCWVFVAPTQSTAATAGTYTVRVTLDVSDSYENYWTDGNDNGEPKCFYDDFGDAHLFWRFYYLENNGTDTTEKYIDYSFSDWASDTDTSDPSYEHFNDIYRSTGTGKTVTVELPGFPSGFYSEVKHSTWTSWLQTKYEGVGYTFKKFAVYNNSSSTYDSLWEGELYNWTDREVRTATLKFDGTAYGQAQENESNTYKEYSCTTYDAFKNDDTSVDRQQMSNVYTSDNYYTRYSNTFVGWEDKFPAATTITDISGASSIAVNTDGTTTNTESYTVGTVKDQYGVNWYQDASWGTAETSNGVTFSNGTLSVPATSNRSSNYDVTINETCGSATNSKTVTISTFDYIFTLYDEDGSTPLYSGIVDYGSSAVVATPTKAYDSTNHYTFNEWVGDSFTDITTGPQNRSANASYTAVAHTLGDPSIIITEPTCTEAGSGTATCTGCAFSDTVDIPALGHNYYDIYSAPTNGSAGTVCFGCDRCVKYFTSTYDSTTNTYSPNETPVYNTLALAKRNTPAGSKVAAPKFNDFYNETIDYNYAMRGASLKIAEPFDFTDSDTKQGLRFTASLHVPDGVTYTGDANNIVDFGFIYSQTNSEYVNNNINNLTLETVRSDRKIAKMSVADNNSDKGPFNGSNWTGVTAHADEVLGGTTLTFNLLVNVKAYNWTSDYCARAYVVYNYNGHQYTVYDNQFSSRSVEYIARAAAANPDETQKVIDMCNNKIITPINEGWITPPNS